MTTTAQPPHADPYPALLVNNNDDLKTLAQFANLIKQHGNLTNFGDQRGFLGWWSAIVKWDNHKAAMDCTKETLAQVKGHAMERELSRLVLAAAEYFERQYGDGSERVQAAVATLRELGYEPVLHRATTLHLKK